MQGSHAWRGSSAVFDEENLVSHAGLVPLMELADQSGLRRLLSEHVKFTSERVKSAGRSRWPRSTSAPRSAGWSGRRTGLQLLPFNTAFQLVAARGSAALAAARTLLLIPDLIGYWLTGEVGAERTNASTTQLLDVRTGEWATDLMIRLGIRADLFPALREPGSPIGPLRPEIAARTGPARLLAVASHDTASAVAGVPAAGTRFGYISCGTWSRVGVELDRPVLSAPSRAANFTNEVGVDGTIRYLRNVMGLWLLQECLRAWRTADIGSLLRRAAALPALTSIVDADDPVFLPPDDMPARIAAACRNLGQPVPAEPAEFVRCIVDSLALAHRRAVADAERLSGHVVDVLHVVGGGARNALLCQLTADACGGAANSRRVRRRGLSSRARPARKG